MSSYQNIAWGIKKYYVPGQHDLPCIPTKFTQKTLVMSLVQASFFVYERVGLCQ